MTPGKSIAMYLKQFSRFSPVKFWIMIGLSFFASFSESIGMAMFLPILGSSGGSAASGQSDRLMMLIQRIFGWVGADMSHRTVLFFMLCFFALKGLLKYTETLLRGRMAARYSETLRAEVLDSYLEISYSSFQRFAKGEISALLTNENTQAIQGFRTFCDLFVAIASALSFFLFALFTSPGTTFLGFVLAALVALRLQFISRRSGAISKESSQRMMEYNSLMLQALHAFKYLKASARFESFHKKVTAASSSVSASVRERTKVEALWAGFSQPSTVFGLILLIAVDDAVFGRSIHSSLITLVLIYKMMTSFQIVQSNWQQFALVKGSVDAIARYTRIFRRNREQVAPPKPSFFSSELELRDMAVAVDGRLLLEHVSLKIRRGDFIAIVGRSGSGKTTLLDTLCGLHAPSSGTLVLDGTEANSLELRSYRPYVGFVPQDPVIFSGSVLENICAGESEGHLDEPKAWRLLEACGAKDFVESLPNGIHSRIGDRGIPFSGGQKQRIAIARELYRDPSILLLDEPTSALDASSESQVIRTLFSLKERVAVVMVSHRPALLDQADQFLVLDRGQIVERGSFRELVGRNAPFFLKLLDGKHKKAWRPKPRVQPESNIVACCKIRGENEDLILQILDISASGVGLEAPADRDDFSLPVGSKIDAVLELEESEIPVHLEVVHAGSGILGAKFEWLTPERAALISAFVERLSNKSVSEDAAA